MGDIWDGLKLKINTTEKPRHGKATPKNHTIPFLGKRENQKGSIKNRIQTARDSSLQNIHRIPT